MMRLRTCIALEPTTGRTLWVRENLPPDASVFGDGQYVFVSPQEGSEATVLRAADGSVLGKRTVPPESERLATFGRRVLSWRRNAAGARELGLTDAWDQSKAWPTRKYAGDAQFCLLEQERKAAVFEPEGRFVLVDLADGREEIDARVEAEPLLSAIYVLPSADQYLLIVQAVERSTERDLNRRAHPMPGTRSVQIARGRVYAFDREGKPMWPEPVEITDQHLPLDQPRRLPVLAFASTIRERDDGKYRTSISVMAIDKRNGRKVVETSLERPTSRFQVVGDPDKREVVLQLQQDTVALTLTDKPIPDESTPEEPDAEAQDGDAPPL